MPKTDFDLRKLDRTLRRLARQVKRNRIRTSARTPNPLRVPVIIQFRKRPDRSELARLHRLLSPYRIAKLRRLRLIRSVAGVIPVRCLGRICGSSGVYRVYADRKNACCPKSPRRRSEPRRETGSERGGA